MNEENEEFQDVWRDIRPPDQRTYAGTRLMSEGTCRVFVLDSKRNSKELPLYTHVANHSPTGFEWGYGGSGPAQLALAILCDHFGNGGKAEEHALNLHQKFKARFIEKLDHSGPWVITSDDIRRFVDEVEPKVGSG